MAKKIKTIVKLQLPAGKATMGPPVGSTLGPHGINIANLVKEFNAKTKDQEGLIVPIEITIYQDRTYTFIVKTPPAAVLIKKMCKIEHGSSKPNKQKVAKINKQSIKEIANIKMPDLNATDIEQAMKIIEGTAKSMGVEVVE